MRLAQVAIDFLIDRADFDTWWFSIKPETQTDIKSALDEVLERHVMLHGPSEEAQRRADAALRLAERLGYRYCDIPACNCGGYHK